nr:DUF1667 domain-containing protein [uncultured Dysosmobacter sp.]
MKELTCIVCPKGCRLRVDEDRDYAVTGNGCSRGAEYARAELTAPTRVVTSTVRCAGGSYPRCPVKTDRPIPKGEIQAVMAALAAVQLTAPVQLGQVVLEDVCGTGANIVATRAM